MKTLLRISLMTATAFAMTACNGGGGGSTPDYFSTIRNSPDVNKNAWYNSMAQICSEGEPRPGCNFKYDGSKVTKGEDPFIDRLNGGFLIEREPYTATRWNESCDFDGYCTDTSETYTNYRYFVHIPGGGRYTMADWTRYQQQNFAKELGGWIFAGRTTGVHFDVSDVTITSPSGMKYGYDGVAINAARTAGGQQGQDVMGTIAEVRADQVKGISEVLQAKFSLDADVSEQAAASLVDWSEIGSKRARTHADMAAFSKRVYGIELGRIEDVALLARDGKTELALKEMDSLVGEAAQNWRTSPETMREVLNYFYGNLAQ
ncbi:MAG: hypothetical protein AB7F59_04710 [Bdellovibrionales bacterium]